MDKRKNNGGVRSGAGRKKGSGVSGKIKMYVDEMMHKLIEDKELKKEIINDLIQMKFDSGYIYIIRDLETNFVKVGVTQRKNPKQRLSLYITHNMKINLLFIDYVENCFELEEEINQSLKNREKGDWFNLSFFEILQIVTKISKHKNIKIFNGDW